MSKFNYAPTYNGGRIALFAFTGTDRSLHFAIVEATHRADEWLALHQWRDANGQSAYRMHTDTHMDGGYHIYTIFLLGPSDSPVAPDFATMQSLGGV